MQVSRPQVSSRQPGLTSYSHRPLSSRYHDNSSSQHRVRIPGETGHRPSARPSLIRTGHGTHSPFASGELFTPERKPLMEGTGSSNAKAVHSEAEPPGRAGTSGRTLGSQQGSEVPAVALGPWQAAPGSQPDARAHGSKCHATAVHQPRTPRSPGATRGDHHAQGLGSVQKSRDLSHCGKSPKIASLCNRAQVASRLFKETSRMTTGR